MRVFLFEILVPAGFPIEHHEKWDAGVMRITGGLTLSRSVEGRWQGEKERMIPVRVAGTHMDMQRVAAFTKEHYEQTSVMYYLISPEVYFV